MPRHVIVDGSNLATEGRTMPSLKQLIEAVGTFMADHPADLVTVVVDATFGHRIDPAEVAQFDEAVENNEIVTPPAGAVGRGDAFVLAIAEKVAGTILSNDSFQELHGTHPWLFEEGRLIGGKPVPHVGWVFIERVPVRGPISRKAQRDARQKPAGKPTAATAPPAGRPSKAASLPMPVPSGPPPGGRGRRSAAATAAPDPAPVAEAVAADAATPTMAAPAPHAPGRNAMINDLLPFLSFVEQHPVGSMVHVTVESYSSHGAYVRVGDARAYLPLRNISDPPPRSAREVVKLGDELDLVVQAFHPQRRGVDLATPAVLPPTVPAAAEAAAPKKRATRKRAAAPADVPVVDEAAAADSAPVAEPAPTAARAGSRKGRGRSAAEVPEVVEPVAAEAPASVEAAPAKKSTRRSKAASATADVPQPVEPAPQPQPAAATAIEPATPRRGRAKAAPVGVAPPADAAAPIAAEASTAPAPRPRGRKPAAQAASPALAEPEAQAVKAAVGRSRRSTTAAAKAAPAPGEAETTVVAGTPPAGDGTAAKAPARRRRGAAPAEPAAPVPDTVG